MQKPQPAALSVRWPGVALVGILSVTNKSQSDPDLEPSVHACMQESLRLYGAQPRRPALRSFGGYVWLAGLATGSNNCRTSGR
jgi:hypothetical protein